MINISRLYLGIESSSDNIRYHSNGNGPVVVYNCTNKCSQNCLHCYSKTGLAARELDTQQAKELLNQLAEIKCPVVLFSGGEPLERADIFELLDFSHKLGLRTVLSTNGNLIDSKVAGELFDLGVNYVGISIDGTEKTHDSFRGVPGSFAKALNAVKFCEAVNLKVGLRFTITNRNFNQIADIFSLAQKLNIRRICFYHLISAGRAVKNNLKCTAEQTRQALDDILDCAKKFAAKGVTEALTVGNHADGAFVLNRLKQENSPFYEKSLELLQKFGGNKIGTKIFAVDASGNVHPDQFWQNFSLGNITEIKLAEIFKKSLNIFSDKTKFAPDRCKNCRWLKICGTNMRFFSLCHSREGGNPKVDLSAEALAKVEWILEPDCYLSDEEVEGKQNEFASQNAKA
ncbi:MAG: radical SAM protein [Phycisphaerae bacterium]|jgi:radical SAM protein with 4Fe4S-binding SPASM domain